MEKFYGIQYLRGIAAGLVIIYHSMVMIAVAPYFDNPVGDFGVDIFFVISGFIMWVTTEGKNKGIREFWVSRILRVAPLYWLFTFVLVAAALLMPSLFFNSRGVDPVFLLKSLFFIPAQNPDVGDITPVYTIGWTLTYEMFFYAIFGLSLALQNLRMRLLFIAAVIVTLAIVGSALAPEGPLGKTYTSPIIIEFLLGVLLGVTRQRWVSIGLLPTILLVGTSSVALVLADFTIFTRSLVYGVPAFFLVAGFVSIEKYIRSNINKLALLFGEASYSLYLSHPISQRIWYVIFVTTFGQITSLAMAVWYAVGAVTAGLLGGVVCYLLVEKYLLKLAKIISRSSLNAGPAIEVQR
ncbi:acyltransferase [Pseudomonas sp. DCB_CB]|uniref:acyltransferase family protein n=1 Tax=unclassified Pseudomonas TaxID=196821 RepID=UPI002248ADC9|nr:MULTISPECIES: acyltransferase [unclassified Pseudomonas]MCX2691936.1 acyltransferase [Pseudomonas sp. DCB_BZ]MCX2857277.1 acyltransferase [Pseudomonas sp. DCB_CB]